MCFKSKQINNCFLWTHSFSRAYNFKSMLKVTTYFFFYTDLCTNLFDGNCSAKCPPLVRSMVLSAFTCNFESTKKTSKEIYEVT